MNRQKSALGILVLLAVSAFGFVVAAGPSLPKAYAATTIGTTTTQNAPGLPDGTQVCKGASYYVAFFPSSSSSSVFVYVYETSIDGVTWGSPNSVASDVQVSLSISCQRNNVAYAFVASSTRITHYRYGVIGTTITWNATEHTFSTTHTANFDANVRFDSAGNLWMAISSASGSTTYTEIWEGTSCGGGGCTILDGAAGISCVAPPSCDGSGQMIELTSGKMAVVYGSGLDANDSTLLHALFWSGSSWSSVSTTSGRYSPIESFGSCSDLGDTVYCVDTTLDSSFSGTGKEYLLSVTTGGSWTESLRTDFSTCSTSTLLPQFALSIGGTDMAITCMSASNLYYVSSLNSGATFSSQTVIDTGTFTSGQSTTSYQIISGVLEALWESGASSPYNMRFTALTLAATATVNLKCTMSNGASAATLTLSESAGSSLSPTTVSCDGASHAITVDPLITLTATEPSDGAHSRDRFYPTSTATTTLAITTPSGGSVSWTFHNYFQLQNTYSMSPQTPSTWDHAYSQTILGVVGGNASIAVCSETLNSGGGTASCTGWADWNTMVSAPTNFPSAFGGLWAVNGTVSWTDTTGNNSHTALYVLSSNTLSYIVQTNPNLASSIIVDGIHYNSPQTFFWAVGSIHTIAAASTANLPSSPYTSFTFVRWSDSGAQSHSVTAPSSSTIYTATYTTTATGISCGSPNPLQQLEKGCIVPALLTAWSAPIGLQPWLGFVLLGTNVAIYNKTQNVWVSLTILWVTGATFFLFLPAYVGLIAQVFLYIGTAGLVIKGILSAR